MTVPFSMKLYVYYTIEADTHSRYTAPTVLQQTEHLPQLYPTSTARKIWYHKNSRLSTYGAIHFFVFAVICC